MSPAPINVTTAWIHWRLLLLQMCGVYLVFSHALHSSGSRYEQCECLLALLCSTLTCWRYRKFKYVHRYLRHVTRRVRKTADSDYWLRSVRPSARNNSATKGRVFMKFNIWGFFTKTCRENSSFIKIWQDLCIIW